MLLRLHPCPSVAVQSILPRLTGGKDELIYPSAAQAQPNILLGPRLAHRPTAPSTLSYGTRFSPPQQTENMHDEGHIAAPTISPRREARVSAVHCMAPLRSAPGFWETDASGLSVFRSLYKIDRAERRRTKVTNFSCRRRWFVDREGFTILADFRCTPNHNWRNYGRMQMRTRLPTVRTTHFPAARPSTRSIVDSLFPTVRETPCCPFGLPTASCGRRKTSPIFPTVGPTPLTVARTSTRRVIGPLSATRTPVLPLRVAGSAVLVAVRIFVGRTPLP